MLQLWPADPGPRFRLISVTPAAAAELTRTGRALAIGTVCPADLRMLFFAPPALELQPLAGDYPSAQAFEQAFLTACPLLQAIRSTLDHCGRNPVRLSDRLAGGPVCSRYPSQLVAPGEIDLHFPLSAADSDHARRELLSLLEHRLKVSRRAEIWAHYIAGRIVACRCRDDAGGELEAIGRGHLRRPTTVLQGNRLKLTLSTGPALWEIARVTCESVLSPPPSSVAAAPPQARPPIKAELLFERWFAPQVSRPPTKSKAEYWAEAKRLFPNLSRRGFERVRGKLVAGNEQWTQAGRRFNH